MQLNLLYFDICKRFFKYNLLKTAAILEIITVEKKDFGTFVKIVFLKF